MEAEGDKHNCMKYGIGQKIQQKKIITFESNLLV